MSKSKKEIWKPVEYQGISYKGLYEVSNLGRARKVSNNKVRYVCDNTKIRQSMCLTKDKVSISAPLARVILASFYGTQFTRTFVADHINNIPTDNRLSNLQAITQRENIKKDRPKQNRPKSEQALHIGSITLNGNQFYNPTTVYLGRYKTKDQLIDATKVAISIIKLYKIKNNDKVKLAVMEGIGDYRLSQGLPKIRRTSFSSTKSFGNIYRSYGIYKYVYCNTFLFNS